MSLNSVETKCPACTGPLRFDPSSGKLKCDYCDSLFTPEEAEAFWKQKQEKEDAKASAAAPEAEQDEAAKKAARVSDANAGGTSAPNKTGDDAIQDYLNSKKTMEEAQGSTAAVKCSSCGATLMVSDVDTVTKCPYCGNNSIVPGTLGDTLEPDYVIPFEKTKEDALNSLKSHCQGKICLPKAFTAENHLEEVQGVYVPFWLYDGDTNGTAHFTCTNVRVFDDGDDTITETDTWKVTASGKVEFTKVPADASKRMPNDHMDSIEPFDYGKIKPFSTAYLPGFAAERYDDEVKDCAERVKTRMDESLKDQLRGCVGGYDTVSCDDVSANNNITKVGYGLFPVWMLHTRWNDRDFLFAMNGQTGKFIGDLPCDKAKLNLISIGSAVAAFAVVFAATFLFLG